MVKQRKNVETFADKVKIDTNINQISKAMGKNRPNNLVQNMREQANTQNTHALQNIPSNVVNKLPYNVPFQVDNSKESLIQTAEFQLVGAS